MPRGFGAVKVLFHEQEERREEAKNRPFIQDFRLADGQTKDFRPNGAPTEPLTENYHLVKYPPKFPDPRNPNKADFRSERCQKTDTSEECVFCFYKDNGNKRIGKPSPRSGFLLIDASLYHDIPQANGKINKYTNKPYTNEIWCSDDQRCPQCAQGVDRRYGGQKFWLLSIQYTGQLSSQVDNIGRDCAVCIRGRIRHRAWLCPRCANTIQFDPATQVATVCKTCNGNVQPIESVVCDKGCKDARRVTMWDGMWSVTRSGKETNTSYNFNFRGVQPMDDWMFDLNPPDVEELMKPKSFAKAAADIGVQNPFQGGTVSTATHQETQMYGTPQAAPAAPQRMTRSARTIRPLTGNIVGYDDSAGSDEDISF